MSELTMGDSLIIAFSIGAVIAIVAFKYNWKIVEWF